MQVNPYLTFNGNCRKAMTFYQECLGGQLCFQTAGESPLSEKMPKKMKDCIVHAALTHGSFVLMGTDMVNENGLLKGNNVSISLSCVSESDIASYYQKLSKGGIQNHPLKPVSREAMCGDLTDRFGNHWILNCIKKTGNGTIRPHTGHTCNIS